MLITILLKHFMVIIYHLLYKLNLWRENIRSFVLILVGN